MALVWLVVVFAMAELAIVSSRKARLEARARAGKPGARAALALAGDPGRFLSTTQVGTTLIGIIAGAYSGARLGAPVAAPLVRLGVAPDTSSTLGFAAVIGLSQNCSQSARDRVCPYVLVSVVAVSIKK